MKIARKELYFLIKFFGADWLDEKEERRFEEIKKKYGYWEDPKDMFKVEPITTSQGGKNEKPIKKY